MSTVEQNEKFYLEKINLFNEFVNEIKTNDDAITKYPFEELYRSAYMLYKKSPQNAIALYYNTLAKLYDRSPELPAANKIKMVNDVFMHVIRKSQLGK